MIAKRRTLIRFEFTEASSADLRGKQSVRTTFKLSERSINALSLLAIQLGIKQKSLFDHLMEDNQALEHIAREFEDFETQRIRVAKTYVISRKTLEVLERISLEYGTPRDALVEYSIERILPLLIKEKKRHAKRKEIATEAAKYLQDGVALMAKVEATLGQDDPVFEEIFSMMRGVNNCSDNIASLVARGSKIEEF
ncbi:MAG: hypothetical protein COA36_08280 [Desulfotalea sp.]|nr:MAG: hypothetical protein COA36_08280 [Desulfotalea sp.]